MNTSPSIEKIAPAVLAAQRQIGGVAKDSTNPHYRSGYASLGAVIHAVKFALNEQGISVLQPIGRDELGDYVETILLHESGEYMADKIRLVCAKQNDPQAAGSAQSYARRYGLQAFLTLPTADDDAEAATYRQEQTETQTTPPKAKPASKKPVEPISQNPLPQTWKAYVFNVDKRSGIKESTGKLWTVYDVTFDLDGDRQEKASTFDAKLADAARKFNEDNILVSASVLSKERGFELLGMVPSSVPPLN